MKVYGLCRGLSTQYHTEGFLTYPTSMKSFLEGLDTKTWTVIRLDIGQHEFDKLQQDNKELRRKVLQLEEKLKEIENER